MCFHFQNVKGFVGVVFPFSKNHNFSVAVTFCMFRSSSKPTVILYIVLRYYLKGLRLDLQTLKVNPFGMLCVSPATDFLA